MVFKLNISDEKGKAWKLETESDIFMGMRIGDKVEGKKVSSDLEGYELEITGTSDKSGFPGAKDIDSINLKRKLLTRGFGMKKARTKGLRKKKTLRGGIISEAIVQINMKVLKPGKKKLAEIFPDQNKPKEDEPFKKVPKKKEEEPKKEEKKVEEGKAEEPKVEKKEEVKAEEPKKEEPKEVEEKK